MSRPDSKKFTPTRWMSVLVPLVLFLLALSLVASILIVLLY